MLLIGGLPQDDGWAISDTAIRVIADQIESKAAAS